jgi:hypothetical protein
MVVRITTLFKGSKNSKKKRINELMGIGNR